MVSYDKNQLKYSLLWLNTLQNNTWVTFSLASWCVLLFNMWSYWWPAEWLKQASQWHDMHCHDLEVMRSNPGQVELRVHSTSVLSRTWTKIFIYWCSCDFPECQNSQKRNLNQPCNEIKISLVSNFALLWDCPKLDNSNSHFLLSMIADPPAEHGFAQHDATAW